MKDYYYYEGSYYNKDVGALIKRLDNNIEFILQLKEEVKAYLTEDSPVDVGSDGEYLSEMAVGMDRPVKFEWRRESGAIIPITATLGSVEVVDKDGSLYRIRPGSNITNTYIFAGKGSRPYNKFNFAADYVAAYAVKEEDKEGQEELYKYSNNPDNWFHAKGRCFVTGKNGDGIIDFHWVECAGIGAVDKKIKNWINDRPDKDEGGDDDMYDPEYECGIFTESGIMFETRDNITEGRVFEMVKEANQLLLDGDNDGFEKLAEESRGWMSDDERLIFLETVLPHFHSTILGMLSVCDYERIHKELEREARERHGTSH
jgi:hypothetical protein